MKKFTTQLQNCSSSVYNRWQMSLVILVCLF